MALLLELVQTFAWVKALPEVVTSAGVAYLVVMERRRARRLTALERTSAVLVKGHAGNPEAHRTIADTLKETADVH